MQEKNGVPGARGSLRLVPAVIIVIVLLWVLLWLIFKGTSSQPSNNHTPAKPKQSTSGQAVDGGAAGSTVGGGSGPTQLANTGAGDVLVPMVLTGLVGGVLYQVRLRRQLNG